MTVHVRLPGVLREHAGGTSVLEVAVPDGSSVNAVLDRVALDHPSLGRRIRDERGALRRHVNVFVGAEDIRRHEQLETVVPPGVEVFIAPAVSGG